MKVVVEIKQIFIRILKWCAYSLERKKRVTRHYKDDKFVFRTCKSSLHSKARAKLKRTFKDLERNQIA